MPTKQNVWLYHKVIRTKNGDLVSQPFYSTIDPTPELDLSLSKSKLNKLINKCDD